MSRLEDLQSETRTMLQCVSNLEMGINRLVLLLEGELSEIEKTVSRLHNELTDLYSKNSSILDEGEKDGCGN